MSIGNKKGWKSTLVLFNSLLWCVLILVSFRSICAPLPAGGETLQYTVNYQGALSGSLPLAIAQVSLQLHPGVRTVDGIEMRHASLALSTEHFAEMEALHPLRFYYDSWFDPGLNHSVMVEMRKHFSTPKHELLWFNQREGQVRFFRKGSRSTSSSGLPAFLTRISQLQQPEKFRQRRAVALVKGSALDRLAMLYAVRGRSLAPGDVVELAVSNGKDLLAYKIAVEAREQVQIADKPVASLRVSFTPRFDSANEEGYNVRAWLSDDEKRIPLRFRGSGLGGVFTLNLDHQPDKG